MEFKVILSNGRQTFVDADNEKELQTAITKAKSTFGCEVSKVVPMNEEKFSVGGFLTGSVIGVALASLFGVEKKNLTRDRKFVNKKQGYEKSYASGTGRTGYKGNTKFKTGGITKQADGTYTHPSGFVIEPYDKGRYILLDPEGMDAVGEHMSLAEAKQTLNDMLEHEEYKTGGGVKNIPIAIKRKIDEINAMLPKVKEADDLAGGYFGSTHYSYVSLLKPIEIKGQYVYIYPEKGLHFMSFEKRYNVSKTGEEWGGKKHLMSDLSIILKAFKGVSKDKFETGGKTASDEVYKEVFDYIVGGDRPKSFETLKNQTDAKAKKISSEYGKNLSIQDIYNDIVEVRETSSQFKTGGGVGSENKMWSMKFYSTELANPRKKLSYYIRRDVIEAPSQTKAINIAKKKHNDFGKLISIQEVMHDKKGNLKYETGGGVGKFEYKTIDTRSAQGLKDAEKLKASGWKIISTGFNTIQFERLKSGAMPKKHSKGGLLGQSAKVEFLSEEFATEELVDDLKEKSGITSNSTGDVPVIAFAYTDYGGSFLDKVAIQYFQENYPENIVTEVTGWSGENAFVFGDPAQEWMDSTEDYPLGFEDFEEFYYSKENEAEMEGFEYFIDNELSTDEYAYDKDELMSWLGENRGGYFSVTTQGLDYSTDDLMDAVMESGYVTKINEDEEFGRGGSAGKSLVVSYSSYFDYNKYDTEMISKVVRENGGTDVHLEKDQGMSNQPDVVVFKGDKTRIERALNDAMGTEYIRVSEKDWRTKKFKTGGGVERFSTLIVYSKNISKADFEQEARKLVGFYDLKIISSDFQQKEIIVEGIQDIYVDRSTILFVKHSSNHESNERHGGDDYFRTGGGVQKSYNNPENATHVLHIDGYNWYLEKIDSTHFYMSNSPDFRGMAHHIGQHKGEPYYDEVKQWLSDTNMPKYADGGMSSMPMAGMPPQVAIANEISNKLPATTSAIDKRIAERIHPTQSRWSDRGLDGYTPLPYGKGYGQTPMYGKGGSVGEEITFRHWSGETKHGTIVEIFPDGSLDVSCGFGHCLVNKSDIISGAEKMARGSKIDEFNDIMENNVITEKQVNLIKTRLNSGALKSDAEIVQYIWENTPDLTPDQNKKGIEFLMNLYKTPTGKERSNHVFGYRETEALENFGHFALAGFHDASRYGQAPYYIPMYDVYGKDGEYGFQYYYDGKVNIVGKKGMKTATAGWRRDRMFVDKSAKHEMGYAKGHSGRSGYKGKKYAGGGTIDNDAVRELQLFLENDGQLYSQRFEPIQKNLMTKLAQGNYDHMMAQKGFMILVEVADKKYQKDLGSGSGKGFMLSMASRKELCKILEEEFYSNAKDGEYDHLIPKKYVGKTIQYKNGGSAGKSSSGKNFHVVDMRKYEHGAEDVVVASFDTRSEASEVAKQKNKSYDPDTKMFSVMTTKQLHDEGYYPEGRSGLDVILPYGFYVKINPYYTATIRDLKSFEQYLKRKDEIWGKEFGKIVQRDKTASKEWVARMNELIEQKLDELDKNGSSNYKVGESISVFRNQADRDAYVIAVSGHEILIEYAMPNDTTALNIIDTTLPDYNKRTDTKNYVPISYSDAKNSKKWGSKIDASKLINNPQSGAKFGNGGTAGSKVYYEQQGVGTAKYVINFYDGVKTHNDGSEFFDIRTFKNKVGKDQFIEKLKSDGYKERSSFGKGGSAGNPKEPIAFSTSNLYFNGFGRDVNGNKVIRLSLGNSRAFSIQLNNGSFPKTYKPYGQNGFGDVNEQEINQYVKEFGSDAQKKRLKIYKS